ncbi:MAG: DUF1003 domain-containing protein [Candidatus Eremiobacteraeota bacterium]|nr:DUF1003 domain-containing protein [Candidatus Eremiobacteraeota bacterium]
MDPNRSLPGQVDTTIDSIAELERRALERASLDQRYLERLTLAIGRPRTLYLVAAVVAGWVALNVALRAVGRAAIDPPPFYALDSVLTITAVLMTVVILATQNRAGETAEQRARLHLQISLLAERKIAKLIQLLEELRYDLPSVPNREDREAEEFTLATDPHAVAAELEKRAPSFDEPVR